MSAPDELPAEALEEVVDLLARRGRAVCDYRPAPIGRRVLARMASLGLTDVGAYAERLRRDPGEADALAEALLVQVTSFFRDPEVFAALERQVLPDLLARAGAGGRPLRAWVVGAATGQEAYSVAMVLADLSAATGVPFEVLATDVSEDALAHARRGVYTPDEVASLDPERRRRFLVTDGAGHRVNDALAARVRFVHHDVLGPRLTPRESIVASFEVVLCRNVLIYFEARSQALACERFAQVLVEGGALVLGHAEAVPPASTSLAPFPDLPPALRVFVRRGTP